MNAICTQRSWRPSAALGSTPGLTFKVAWDNPCISHLIFFGSAKTKQLLKCWQRPVRQHSLMDFNTTYKYLEEMVIWEELLPPEQPSVHSVGLKHPQRPGAQCAQCSVCGGLWHYSPRAALYSAILACRCRCCLLSNRNIPEIYRCLSTHVNVWGLTRGETID